MDHVREQYYHIVPTLYLPLKSTEEIETLFINGIVTMVDQSAAILCTLIGWLGVK